MKKIEDWLHSYKIENYSLRHVKNEWVIDVGGNVDLLESGLAELPFKFGIIEGDFNIGNYNDGIYREKESNPNTLSTLHNCPEKVLGNFIASNIGLKSLKGAPSYVGESMDVGHNQLTHLRHSPSFIKRSYHCGYNQLVSLEGCPPTLEYLMCHHNRLKSLAGSASHIKENFNCSNNLLKSLEAGPLQVEGKYWCSDNQLKTLEHLPQEIESLDCCDNQITSLQHVGLVSNQIEAHHNPLTIEGVLELKNMGRYIFYDGGDLSHTEFYIMREKKLLEAQSLTHTYHSKNFKI